MTNPHTPSPRFTALLQKTGLVDAADLARALAMESPDSLPARLEKLGVVREDDVAAAIAAHLRLPVYQLAGNECDATAVRALPQALAEKHAICPIRLEGRALHLAMIDP